MKLWAIISIWDPAARIGRKIPNVFMGAEFEKIDFFDTKREAEKEYYNRPQGQDHSAGELNRLLVKTVKRWR